MSLSEILSALGDHRRLQVVQALKENGPMTQRQIAETIGEWEGTHSSSEYRVRRAVKVLSEAGIVEEIGAVPVRVILLERVVGDAGRKLIEIGGK
jgi:DNA-binding Lrp family transcriptional regulator